MCNVHVRSSLVNGVLHSDSAVFPILIVFLSFNCICFSCIIRVLSFFHVKYALPSYALNVFYEKKVDPKSTLNPVKARTEKLKLMFCCLQQKFPEPFSKCNLNGFFFLSAILWCIWCSGMWARGRIYTHFSLLDFIV